MKMVYIAEKEELQELIRECIHQEIDTLMKSLNQKTTPERLSLPDAAQYLGIKKATMYGLTSSRKIPFHKFGRRIFFNKTEVDEWMSRESQHYRPYEELATEHLAKMAQRKRRY